jgi:predicted amidophosphoribosyltransferase
MALIKCCECGSEISDKALVCMNCGKPIKCNNNNTKKIVLKNMILLVYVVLKLEQ